MLSYLFTSFLFLATLAFVYKMFVSTRKRLDDLVEAVKQIDLAGKVISQDSPKEPGATRSAEDGEKLEEILSLIKDFKTSIAANQSRLEELLATSLSNLQILLQRILNEPSIDSSRASDDLVGIGSRTSAIALQTYGPTDIARGQPVHVSPMLTTEEIKEEVKAKQAPSEEWPFTYIDENVPLKHLNEVIEKYRQDIEQASTNGAREVQSLAKTIGDPSIQLKWESDRLFVLSQRDIGSFIIGKAYVMPGTRLGRPFIDWFDLPKGVYERIERTLEPATIYKAKNGDWQVKTKGRVQQE